MRKSSIGDIRIKVFASHPAVIASMVIKVSFTGTTRKKKRNEQDKGKLGHGKKLEPLFTNNCLLTLVKYVGSPIREFWNLITFEVRVRT